ncbi:hypothetical protein BOX15_Mlig033766g4, partial [Macrostomum lignano]
GSSMDFRSLLREQAAASSSSTADNGDASFDAEWRPPTEAEQKVLKARRERSDKIAKRMGEYLLKGWKMLDHVCPDCGTILMEVSNGGGNYCIACRELESDVSKDDPAQSESAARVHAREAAAAAASVASSQASSRSQTQAAAGKDRVCVEERLRTATLDRIDYYQARLLESSDCAKTDAIVSTLDRLLGLLNSLSK